MLLSNLRQNLVLNFHDPLTSLITVHFLPSQYNTGGLKIISERKKDREGEHQ